MTKNMNNDLLPILLEESKNYQTLRKNSYQKYLNVYKSLYSSTYSTLFLNMSNFIQTLSKHALLATILILLALTTISASAAELFAPTQYKPSTIFNLKSETRQVEQPVAVSSSSSLSQISSSSASSTTSSQVSAQSSSSPVSSQEVISNPTPANNIYTNALVPDLRVDYTGWDIEESISPSNMDSSYDNVVSLKKDGSVLKIFISNKGQFLNLSYTSAPTEFNTEDVKFISDKIIRVKNWDARYNVNKTAWQYTGKFYSTNSLQRCGSKLVNPDKICAHPWMLYYNQDARQSVRFEYSGNETLLPMVDQMIKQNLTIPKVRPEYFDFGDPNLAP